MSLAFLEVAEIALVAVQLQQLLKKRVRLIFNFNRPCAITYC